jgi:hypothetical protein
MLIILLSQIYSNEILFGDGSNWKYLDDGTDQKNSWYQVEFDDSNWHVGNAQFGYGDWDESTFISFGSDYNDKHITTYFRTTFNVEDPTLFRAISIHLLRDDGAVVYLNGNEIIRDNMPAGMINYLTTASLDIEGESEDIFYEFLIVNELKVGENTLAVEVHQYLGTSPDFSFDLAVIGLETIDIEVTRGPYLQLSTMESMLIRWRTNIYTPSYFKYSKAGADIEIILSDATLKTEHAFNITGLLPGTKYLYQIGNFADSFTPPTTTEDYYFYTSPKESFSDTIRAWILGDCGTANENQRNVRDAYYNFSQDFRTDMILFLGDNAYINGTDLEYQYALFEDMYEDILQNTVSFSCIGNHDGHTADSNSQWGPYYDIFNLPTNAEAGGVPSGTEAYYSYNYGNIHFIVLDSYETDRGINSPMYNWLDYDLSQSLSDWNVALWHHPPYTKGSHNSDISTDSDGSMKEMRENFLPLIESYGVDLVLSGHSHSYERSYFVHGHYDFSWTLTEEMILDNGNGQIDGDGEYKKIGTRDGTVYVVTGSSGKKSGGSLNHPVMYASLNTLGSTVMEVIDNELGLQFINDNGEVADHFTIIKAFCSTGDINGDGQVNIQDIVMGVEQIMGTTILNDYQLCSFDMDDDNDSILDIIKIIDIILNN